LLGIGCWFAAASAVVVDACGLLLIEVSVWLVAIKVLD